MTLKESESAADLAPDDLAYQMYVLLTEENKERVNRFVAALKETQ